MNHKYSHNKNSDKKIWIDFDNSPHVPFFAPIIERLINEGYNIKISARNYSQTIALANLYGLKYTAVGKHHGKNKFIKIIGLIYRSLQLIPFAFKTKPTIAISHGSRSQMIVATLFRIPIVMFLDYEFVQTIPFVKPGMIFLPNLISSNKLKSFGPKVKTYPGIKEDIYVPSFKPDITLKKEYGISDEKITVVLRPPAHEAHYHNKESEVLFEEVIDYITTTNNVYTIILPRDKRQKQFIFDKFKSHFESNKLCFPDKVMNGLNLMWYSDLVISGGGTMNREATALGVPVYSIFRGTIGDVDKYLSKNGRLILIESNKDVRDKIKLIKRNHSQKIENVNSLALQSIINNLESFIAKKTNSELQYVEKNFDERETTERRDKKIQ